MFYFEAKTGRYFLDIKLISSTEVQKIWTSNIYILSYLVWTSYFFKIISIVLGGLVCFELKPFRSVFSCQPFCAQLSGAQGVWPWNSLSRCPMASEPFWWQSRRMWMNSSILPLAMEKNMRIFIKYDKTDHEIP